ncbi:WecB/TagA/CpsF family glycosyltransferase [Microbispora sp. ATCC PTA-5024]|uniref:WecB/TagA/CpsF family glycosyltransferase n=1 Tax=Microbispora sp. ATCC PTA-5024 TaxID=316330 RepID=UPI0003DC5687|nr:WecB/TagA/CpsF family glycosyltransferase [Microbispora sp. ATCC PTA-5024]ETK34316.1 UDP-N-acetyl-D-mannosamine transferase [Microbispora sp. ATCC PTA-5024]
MTAPGRARRRSVLGTTLDAMTMREVVAACVDAVDGGGRLTIGVVNAAKIVNMRTDGTLRRSVLDCDLILADGQAVVWAARVLGHPLPERVAGIDLFVELLAEGERRGYRPYFLGATPEVLALLVEEVRRGHPALRVAGARDGYFAAEDSEAVAAEIADSGADMLFLGITSPKKEIFVRDWGEATGAKVIHGVGGSFDVLSGRTRRAPRTWQRLGLEWLYRLLQEPVRLGPRYLKTNGRFLLLVAVGLMRRGRD